MRTLCLSDGSELSLKSGLTPDDDLMKEIFKTMKEVCGIILAPNQSHCAINPDYNFTELCPSWADDKPSLNLSYVSASNISCTRDAITTSCQEFKLLTVFYILGMVGLIGLGICIIKVTEIGCQRKTAGTPAERTHALMDSQRVDEAPRKCSLFSKRIKAAQPTRGERASLLGSIQRSYGSAEAMP